MQCGNTSRLGVNPTISDELLHHNFPRDCLAIGKDRLHDVHPFLQTGLLCSIDGIIAC